jgi:hypothetical protein
LFQAIFLYCFKTSLFINDKLSLKISKSRYCSIGFLQDIFEQIIKLNTLKMKKNLFFLVVIFFTFSALSYAQTRSAFRTGYTRLGINKLGSDLDYNLSPKQNVFDGRYGAGTGYVFEFGRIFYFANSETTMPKLINFGLDWTILSLNYNKMDKWEKYARATSTGEYFIDGTKIAAAISSKLGPVISFNPVEKLVIDARFQVAPVVRFFDLTYADNYEQPNERYFSFINYAGEETESDYNPESVKNRIAFGVATSFGITVRRKAIGLSIDYISGDVKSNYEYASATESSNGKVKIPAKNLQLKLSLSL